MNLDRYFQEQRRKIDRALEGYLPPRSERPLPDRQAGSSLHEAMRYAVLLGGKRVRPILALAACEVVSGDQKEVMPAACAIEFIHNYSLVHDDLPCMDDDDIRRGKPSCHKKFGEGAALLAGDALLTLAFQILSAEGSKKLKPRLEAIRLISEAIGNRGMIGGQVVDIETKGKEIDLPTIEYINTHKSGALIAVSLRVGAVLGGGNSGQVNSLFRYGKYAGLLFQIVDDILDGEGYAKLIGISQARKEAERLCGQAKEAIKGFGKKSQKLEQIADFILKRNR